MQCFVVGLSERSSGQLSRGIVRRANNSIGLSEIGSLILRRIADNADRGLVSKSTEEVLHKIEKYNTERFQKNPGLRKLIIASMDIEKFFPSILSGNSAKIIKQIWEES